MGYVALYREWRPKVFDDVVGQEHVSRTLQNAILNNRIAHAYLFCGPRGTGKTSTAKVFAKSLNCLQGPTANPCNQCQNCLGINQGSSMDVLEIDAASNRGIDEIRDLRDKVKFSPTEGKYKVYIIDEVHMLTTEAFNALLKTLEEPPQHVVFILATTEPHKIPMTILSRCQRFDFRRITTEAIIDRLTLVAEQSGFKAEKDALALIARAAEGGLRDALSLLDQCIAFGGQVVTVEEVNAVLGAVSSELLSASTKSLAEGNTPEALNIINQLVAQGKDVRQYVKDLVEYLRNLLLLKVCTDAGNLMAITDEALAILRREAEGFSQERLVILIAAFSEVEKEMKWSTQPRLMVELCFIKCNHVGTQLNPQTTSTDGQSSQLLAKMAELEAKIAQLEGRVASGAGSAIPQPTKKTAAAKARSPRPVVNLGENQTAKLQEIKSNWSPILEGIKRRKITIHALIISSSPVHFNGNVLTLVFPEDNIFHLERLAQDENRNIVEQVISSIVGKEIKVRCVTNKDLVHGNESKVQVKPEEDPMVVKARELFGSEIVEIKD